MIGKLNDMSLLHVNSEYLLCTSTCADAAVSLRRFMRWLGYYSAVKLQFYSRLRAGIMGPVEIKFPAFLRLLLEQKSIYSHNLQTRKCVILNQRQSSCTFWSFMSSWGFVFLQASFCRYDDGGMLKWSEVTIKWSLSKTVTKGARNGS